MTQQPGSPLDGHLDGHLDLPLAELAGSGISAGTLLYLFGDRVVKPAGRFGATHVPYTGASVSEADLAAVAFAASFWSLRQAGALVLQPVERRVLGLVRQHHVAVSMGSAVTLHPGFEDVILRQVAAGRATTYDVVRGWYHRNVRDPEGMALDIARDEMVRLGLAQEVDARRGPVAGFLLGRTRLEPRRDRIGTTYAAFERVHAGWLELCRVEAPLAGLLLESCRRAFRSRREARPD